MIKERYQNPVVGDTVRLRLFTYNSNNLFDVNVEKVEIYGIDPNLVSSDNPDGRIFLREIEPENVIRENTGTYYVDVLLNDPEFVVGKYLDRWVYSPNGNMPSVDTENPFRIYPQLFYSTPIPVVYDFNFFFVPNRIRKGSKQYIRIEIKPNVPRATDLERYYTNLAIVSNLMITIQQKCGPCVPQEIDLRTVVEEEPVDYREMCYGYYLIDTEDMEIGEYDIWFTLDIGGNRFMSDRQTLQISR